MRKVVANGYILCIVDDGNELAENEHHAIMEAIKNKPVAPEGFGYRLKENLEWELYEAEKTNESEEATDTDYQDALRDMGVTL